MSGSKIPFFSDLPPRAIKAACRLWDAIQSPDYNGITAYHDFCHDLTIASVTAPARSLVKRWAAAVQLGAAERPAPFSEVPAARKAQAVPMAEKQAEALPLHQPLPLKARAERKARVKADVFVTDDACVPFQPIISVAMDQKTRQLSDVAISDNVSEPTASDGQTSDGAGVLANVSSLLDAIRSSTPVAVPPVSTLEFRARPALLAVQTAAGRLLEETIVQLSQSIERTAREQTARMLRDVADELERSSS
ncbi:hypothetical protein J5N58_16880 [Rhizobium cremeum]|uniref:hypothetical protein n=1 Tax=Rhizobium cremeum TaxID=2813827 RepID=UPI001FD52FCE|nr:hypothetical protein [Rhizobium cremeum]MCJ7996095.1 hypothetical protein [Rhizobium cremeum]MCJ8001354.1 hypothetical protein [Rhizobium cremeum]